MESFDNMSVLDTSAPDGFLEAFRSYSEAYNVHGVRGWGSFAFVEDLLENSDNFASSVASYALNPLGSWQDTKFVFAFAAALVLLRLLLAGTSGFHSTNSFNLLHAVGARVVFVKKGKLPKFGEAFWYFCWHTISFCWGVWLLHKEAGTTEAPGWVRMVFGNQYWRWYWLATDAERAAGSLGWPFLLASDSMRFFYLTETSFWLSCLIFLFIEGQRSDNLAMSIHHVSTVFLLAFSYMLSNWRIGLVILVLHDIVDVFLYLCKTLHYTTLSVNFSCFPFVGLVVSYFVSRLVLFPALCVFPTLGIRYLDPMFPCGHKHFRGYPGAVTLPGLLGVLLVLHIYWFYLIVRMVLRVYHTVLANEDLSALEDLRSEPDQDASYTSKAD